MERGSSGEEQGRGVIVDRNCCSTESTKSNNIVCLTIFIPSRCSSFVLGCCFYLDSAKKSNENNREARKNGKKVAKI